MSRLMTKPTKWQVRSAKTQISLSIRPVWSVFAVRLKKLGSLATHKVRSEDSDQTGRVPKLIWVFRGWAHMLLFWFCHDAAHMPRGCHNHGSQLYCGTKRNRKTWNHKMGHVMRKPLLAICEQQRCRSACASVSRLKYDRTSGTKSPLYF